MEDMKVGDIVKFGSFYWLVLEVNDNKVLLISKDVLEERRYHDGGTVTWADSEIRQYLNGQFLESFTAAERNKIEETRIRNADNPWYGTPGGRNTTDHIFLLSLDEVVRYFGDSGQLENPVNRFWLDDQFNDARIARSTGGRASWWWLRSPGGIGRNAVIVSCDGALRIDGLHVYICFSVAGVRPVLLLNLQSWF